MKKILLVAPPFIPVSKNSLAGIEQITYSLGKSLVEQGNDVFTVAREESEVYGNLVEGWFSSAKSFQGAESEYFHQAMAYESSIVRNFIRENQDLDYIIDRCEGMVLPIAHEENGPLVISALDLESKFYLHPHIFARLRNACSTIG